MAFSTTEITSSHIASDNPVHQRLVFAYQAASQLVSGNLLEIGCGVGRGIDLLAPHGTHYTGIDKNTDLLNQLRATHPALTFIEAHIPPLRGIADNQFDFVVSFQVIEHIQNDDLFVQEIHRVLKPGGKLIVTTPNIKQSLTRNPWHIREYTARQLETLLRKHFAKIDLRGVQGNEKVSAYFDENRKSVARITRFDIFNLQYRLPRAVLQIPYDVLNRLNRKRLMQQRNGIAAKINYTDYFLTDDVAHCLDFFYVAEK